MVSNQNLDQVPLPLWGLACAALDPRLNSILIFDASSKSLGIMASQLAAMLEVAAGQSVAISTLGVADTEDDLWGAYVPQSDLELVWQAGRLVTTQNSSPTRVILIPDLVHLSLPATRACLMLMGADVAHLERHGYSTQWAPRLYWVAGGSRVELAQLSSHLLDRFALRLPGSDVILSDLVEEVHAWATGREPANSGMLASQLSVDLIQRLREATNHRLLITEEALARTLWYFPRLRDDTQRREIALARLAVAYARLVGASSVTAQHVDSAASIIQLSQEHQEVPPSNASPASSDVTSSDQVTPEVPALQPVSTDSSRSLHLPLDQSPSPELQSIDHLEPIYAPDTQVSFADEAITGPYPEDATHIERAAASLQLPSWHYRPLTASQGPIIGTERARNLQDVAVVSTILEAAKFQKVRRRHQPEVTGSMALIPNDIRSYRRINLPEQMLLLLLDYTCLQGCAWLDALLEHLRWAYLERAKICLVQVGSAKAIYPLQAQQIVALSLMSPQLLHALEDLPGIATPLAHGLDLAMRTLRSMLHHGRGAVQHVRLVVISDGRGNVPLKASLANKITLPVGREGIEDALQMARSIPRSIRVERFFLDPQPREHAELPLNLSQAMGALYKMIPVLTSQYVVEETIHQI